MTAITLAASTGLLASEVAGTVRPIGEDDRAQLADLYVHAHTGAADPEAAGSHHRTAIDTVLQDGRGPVIPEASLVSVDDEGRIIACIVVIERLSRDEDGTGTAFITELFTHPYYRRQGLAEDLLRSAVHRLHGAGWTAVAVTLDDTNAAAMALYLSMDFHRW